MLAEAIVLIPKSANKGTEIQMDVLPLVLCRDCKNSGLDSSGTNGYWCSAHTEWHEAYWFCADGERKEGG